jgi:hypothetical protein
MGLFFKSAEEKEAEFLQEMHNAGQEDAANGTRDNEPISKMADSMFSIFTLGLSDSSDLDKARDAYNDGRENHDKQTK